jgi:hypothetical protein
MTQKPKYRPLTDQERQGIEQWRKDNLVQLASAETRLKSAASHYSRCCDESAQFDDWEEHGVEMPGGAFERYMLEVLNCYPRRAFAPEVQAEARPAEAIAPAPEIQ